MNEYRIYGHEKGTKEKDRFLQNVSAMNSKEAIETARGHILYMTITKAVFDHKIILRKDEE